MIKTQLHTSLAKIFPDEICSPGSDGKMYMLKNQRSSFQLSVISDCDAECTVSAESDISGCISVFAVKNIPAVYTKPDDADDYIIRNGAGGEYPDALMPLGVTETLAAGEYKAFWIEADIPADCASGEHDITLRVTCGEEISVQTMHLHIANAQMIKQKLKCTNWFHTDCLMTYYNVEAFSDEYWRIVENYMLTARRHGVNMILTPLFTPPLDTEVGGERPTVQLVDVRREGEKYYFKFDKLERWIALCDKCGIKYFEMSHLFTQWGAEHAPKIMAQTENGYERIFGWETNAAGRHYADFIRQFGSAFKVFIEKHDIGHRCYFHVSDEPSIQHLLAYRKASKLVDEVFGEYNHIDALSDYAFYKMGYIQTPVPSEERIDDFKGNVPELWTYYCCGPFKNNMPNRFFCMPSLRCRIIGIIMYAYGVDGFLHWGYNFWYTQYSVAAIDPYKVSDAGGHFPSGDSYVVYPGEDGTPNCSLRLKVFYDAVQDYTAMQTLERCTDRETALALIEKHMGKISFSKYSKNENDLIALMREVYSLIESKSAK